MDKLPLIKKAHRERMTVDALKEEINVLSRRATMTCAYLSKLSLCFYLVSAFIAQRTGLHYGSPGNRFDHTQLVMSTFLDYALQRLREKEPELYDKMPDFLAEQVGRGCSVVIICLGG